MLHTTLPLALCPDCVPQGGERRRSSPLGTFTGQIGLVLRAGQTNKGHARARLAPLERLPVRILRVILNAFVQKRGQGCHAYYEYIDGYGARDEPADPKALLGRMER